MSASLLQAYKAEMERMQAQNKAESYYVSHYE
jgi:hypothetical protein